MSDVENNFKESMDWNDYINLLKIDDFEKIRIMNDNNPFLLNKYEYGKRKTNYLFEFYAPFDYINEEAKIVIVGITPGWTQTEEMHKFILNKIKEETTDEKSLKKEAKYNASFSGRMRKNLEKKLDAIGIDQALNLTSSSELWSSKKNLFHPTSLLRFPVFIEKKGEYVDYGGHVPPILEV